jgi:hypothetical protein
VPTLVPTIQTANYVNNSVYQSFLENVDRFTSVSNTISFATMSYKDLNLYGSCPNWQYFSAGSLNLPSSQYYFASVNATFHYENVQTNSFFSEDVACTDADFVGRLVDSVKSGSQFLGRCGENEWRAYWCNNVAVICVDCKFTCGADACPGRLNKIISPCLTCSSPDYAYYSMIRFAVSTKSLFPQFVAQSYRGSASTGIRVVASSRTSVSLQFAFDKAGWGYCYAAQHTVTGTVSSPSVGDVIKLGTYFSIVQASTGINVTVGGLYPSTTYSVYCYTQDFGTNTMTATYMANTSVIVTTACCRQISLVAQHALLPTTSSLTDISSSTLLFQLQLDGGLLATNGFTTKLSLGLISVDCSSGTVISKDTTAIATYAAVTPSVATISWAANSIPYLRSSFAVLSTSSGCFNVTIADASSVSGSNSGLLFRSTSTIVEFASTITSYPTIWPPIISSAVFASSGLGILVSFNASTDLAAGTVDVSQSGYYFNCSQLFVAFARSLQYSKCRWISDDSVFIDLSDSFVKLVDSDCMGPGDSVSLVPNKLRAICKPAQFLCSSTIHNTSALASDTRRISIIAPADTVVPTALLQLSAAVYYGDGLYVDPTGSSGSAGRRWYSVFYNVSILNSSDIVSLNAAAPLGALRSFLSSKNTTDSVFFVPSSLLLANVSYSFVLTVVNTFGRSAVHERTVFVSASQTPVVRMVGPTLVKAFVSQPLYLSAAITVPQVLAASWDNLISWKVYSGYTYYSSFASISNDPSELLLPAFSLAPNSQYIIRITVLSTRIDTATGRPLMLSVSSDTIVHVSKGAVIAVINGGNAAIATSVDRQVSLTSANSIDTDVAGSVLGYTPTTSQQLSVRWSCVQVFPALGGSCRDTLSTMNVNPTQAYRKQTLLLKPTNTSLMQSGTQYDRRTYNVTLTATNSDNNFGQAFVLLTLYKSSVPLVSLGQVPSVQTYSAISSSSDSADTSSTSTVVVANPTSRITASNKLVINGTVTLYKTHYPTIQSTWSCLDQLGASFDLSAVSLSDTERADSVPAASLASGTYQLSIQLSLPANVLTDGHSYTFRLSSVYADGENDASNPYVGLGFADITVVTNANPVGGALSVQPQMGTELTTMFTFGAAGWSDLDDDYPLVYSFYFVAASQEQPTIIQLPRAQPYLYLTSLTTLNQTSMQTTLTSGCLELDYNVTCGVTASDALGGSTVTESSVQVLPLTLKSVATSYLKHYLRAVGATDSSTSTSSSSASTDMGNAQGLNLINADLYFSLLGNVVNVFNSNNCTFAPICNDLNRQQCWGTLHTCGPCLDGFFGEYGDANSFCYEKTASSSRRLASEAQILEHRYNQAGTSPRYLSSSFTSYVLPIGAECLYNFSCFSGICNNGICVDAPKLCPSDCDSAYGSNSTCVYLDIYNSRVNECLQSDALCRAVCVCSPKRYGVDCSLTLAEFAVAGETRELVCAQLSGGLLFETQIDENSILRLLNILQSVTSDPVQLNTNALYNCSAALLGIIQTYAHFAVDDASIGFVIATASNILEVSTYKTLSDELQEAVLEVLVLAAMARQQLMASDEASSAVLSPNVRFSVGKPSASSVYQSVQIASPQVDLEVFNAVAEGSVSLSYSSSNYLLYETCSAVGLILIEYNRNPQLLVSNSTISRLISNCFASSMATTSAEEAQALNAAEATFKLHNHVPIEYIHNRFYMETMTCDPEILPHELFPNCTEVPQLTATCPGEYAFGLMNVTCPGRIAYPVCVSVSGSGELAPDGNCTLQTYDDESTYCQCGLSGAASETSFAVGLGSVGATGRSRRLLTTSYGQSVLLELSTRYTIQSEKAFDAQFIDKGAYAIRSVQKDGAVENFVRVAIIIAVVGFCLCLLLDAFGYAYVKREVRLIEAKSLKDKNNNKVQGYSRRHRTIRNFIDSILPSQFIYKHWHIRLADMIAREHDLCYIFSKTREADLKSKMMMFSSAVNDSSKDSDSIREGNVVHNHTSSEYRLPFRWEKWIVAICKMVSIVFFTTLLCVEYFSDSGQCQEIETEELCVAKKTLFVVSSMCQWDIHIRSCYFRTPLDPFIPTLIVGSIVCIFMIVVDKFVRYIVIQLKIAGSSLMFASKRLESFRAKRRAKKRNVIQVQQRSDSSKQLLVNDAAGNSSAVVHSVLDPSLGLGQVTALEVHQGHGHGLGPANEDIADEFKYAQKPTTMLLQAARLQILHQKVDFVDPEEELRNIVDDKPGCKRWYPFIPPHFSKSNVLTTLRYMCRSFLHHQDNIGDPLTASQLMQHGINNNKPLLTTKLSHSRSRAEDIKSKLVQLDSHEEQDAYLLKRFLVDSMPGVRRTIAYYFFFGHDEDYEHLRTQWLSRFVGIIALPVYLVAAMYYTLTKGVHVIGTRAVPVWIYVCVSVFLFDVFILQPLKIFFKWIVILTTTDSSVRCLHACLRFRARTLLRRKTGLMINLNSLTQHFNPACRAARFYPHLPSARVLLSLTDYDMPCLHHFSYDTKFVRGVVFVTTNSPLLRDKLDAIYYNISILLRSYARFIVYFCKLVLSAMLMMCMSCNDFVHDGIFELAIMGLMNCLLVAFCLTADLSIGFTVVCVVVLVAWIVYLVVTHTYEVDNEDFTENTEEEKVPSPEVDYSVVRFLPTNRFAKKVTRHAYLADNTNLTEEGDSGLRMPAQAVPLLAGAPDEQSVVSTIKALPGPPILSSNLALQQPASPSSPRVGSPGQIIGTSPGQYRPLPSKYESKAKDPADVAKAKAGAATVADAYFMPSSKSKLKIKNISARIAPATTGDPTDEQRQHQHPADLEAANTMSGMRLEDVSEQPYSIYETFKGNGMDGVNEAAEGNVAVFNQQRRTNRSTNELQGFFIDSEVIGNDFDDKYRGPGFSFNYPASSALETNFAGSSSRRHPSKRSNFDEHQGMQAATNKDVLTLVPSLQAHGDIKDLKYLRPYASEKAATKGTVAGGTAETTKGKTAINKEHQHHQLRSTLSKRDVARDVLHVAASTNELGSPNPPRVPGAVAGAGAGGGRVDSVKISNILSSVAANIINPVDIVAQSPVGFADSLNNAYRPSKMSSKPFAQLSGRPTDPKVEGNAMYQPLKSDPGSRITDEKNYKSKYPMLS